MIWSTTKKQVKEIYSPSFNKISSFLVETLSPLMIMTVFAFYDTAWYLLIENIFCSSCNHFIDADLLDVMQMDHVANFAKISYVYTMAV